MQDIIESSCRVHTNEAEQTLAGHMLTLCKSMVLGAAFLAGVAIAASGSAVPYHYRSPPAACSPNRRSSLCQCGAAARQCNTAGGQRLRTAASGRILKGPICQHKGPGATHPGPDK